MTAIKSHDYGCKCERCQSIIKTMLAKTPSGNYFYTDKELSMIAAHEVENSNGR